MSRSSLSSVGLIAAASWLAIDAIMNSRSLLSSSKKAIETLKMKKNGAIVVTDTINNYFTINPMTTKGAIYSDGSYGVPTSNLGSFPTSAKIGDLPVRFLRFLKLQSVWSKSYRH